MVDVLNFISDKLNEIDIPYEFGEWNSTVTYPYFVGSFDETDYRYEDGCTTGVFTLDGWSRDSKIILMQLTDRIKKAFDDLAECVEEPWVWDTLNFEYGMIDDVESTFFIRYGGTTPAPSGEAGLYKVTITLYVYEWEGD